MEPLLVILVFALLCEVVDASIGMGYGTILSPVLLLMGYDPITVIPAVLLSQAVGGFAAARFHHVFGNASLSIDSDNMKSTAIISLLGVLATVLAALIAVNVSKEFVKGYIAVLVLVMGLIILIGKVFAFSWKRLIGLGLLSAFNKGISGGGFGPLITSGQIVIGEKFKNAVAITTAAEAPICIAGFMTYLICTVFNKSLSLDWAIIGALCIGAAVAAPIGAYLTKRLPEKKLRLVIGIGCILVGGWSVYKLI